GLLLDQKPAYKAPGFIGQPMNFARECQCLLSNVFTGRAPMIAEPEFRKPSLHNIRTEPKESARCRQAPIIGELRVNSLQPPPTAEFAVRGEPGRSPSGGG